MVALDTGVVALDTGRMSSVDHSLVNITLVQCSISGEHMFVVTLFKLRWNKTDDGEVNHITLCNIL